MHGKYLNQERIIRMTDKIEVKKLPNLSLYSLIDNKLQFKYRFAQEKYKVQNEIIDYMKSAIIYGAKPEILYDAFSNEAIPYESLVMTDGYFRWSSELLYYVEKYNLVMPKEFTDRAITDKTVKISKDMLI